VKVGSCHRFGSATTTAALTLNSLLLTIYSRDSTAFTDQKNSTLTELYLYYTTIFEDEMNEVASFQDTQARRLREVIRALVRRFSLAERADMSCCGMTVAQAATLQALIDGDLRLSELGKRLGIAPSTLTRNLARLEMRGLIRKEPDPIDGRAQLVALTDAGHDAADEVGRQEELFARSVLDRLPPGSESDSIQTLENLMAAVRSASEACCPGAYDHLFSSSQISVTGGHHE
jgi:DNA-binding MarR family transcriptional regulator